MFENLSDSADSRALAEAIRSTESEIFDEAFNDSTEGDRDAHNDIVEDNSRAESWDGNAVDDGELFREALGEIPAGMAGMAPTIEQEELARENEALREQLAALQGQLPQPERPELFRDPAAWEANVIAQARGEGIPLNDYGTPLPGKPDPFSQPEQYEQWILAEAARQSGVAEHATTRFNASLANAHALHGEDFERAFQDISSMDPRDPRAREAVQSIMRAPDPGTAMLQVHAMLRGADEAATRFGGPPFAPMLARRGAPGAGRAMQARGFDRQTEPVYRTAEHAEEDDVFNAAWDN
jgi:hypothetical protein